MNDSRSDSQNVPSVAVRARNHDENIELFLTEIEQVQQRVVATVNYALGPGIAIDGEIGYTWVDLDVDGPLNVSTIDNYDALEIGIGSSLTF